MHPHACAYTAMHPHACSLACLQVHLTDDGTISIFSRSSENTTVKYPDLAATLLAAKSAGTRSCILDGEVVAYDPEKATLLPFQARKGRGGGWVGGKWVC